MNLALELSTYCNSAAVLAKENNEEFAFRSFFRQDLVQVIDYNIYIVTKLTLLFLHFPIPLRRSSIREGLLNGRIKGNRH
jgi:hypothetical protein